MFQTTTATAVPPRPAYPDAARIVVDTDRRTREMAEAMLRLNAEGGCTETTLQLEGFSLHEQRKLGTVARLIANTGFVRTVEPPPQPTDDEIIAEALALGAPLLRRLVIRLRAHHSDDALGRTWRKIATGLASQIARAPLPERLGNRTEEVA